MPKITGCNLHLILNRLSIFSNPMFSLAYVTYLIFFSLSTPVTRQLILSSFQCSNHMKLLLNHVDKIQTSMVGMKTELQNYNKKNNRKSYFSFNLSSHQILSLLPYSKTKVGFEISSSDIISFSHLYYILFCKEWHASQRSLCAYYNESPCRFPVPLLAIVEVYCTANSDLGYIGCRIQN